MLRALVKSLLGRHPPSDLLEEARRAAAGGKIDHARQCYNLLLEDQPTHLDALNELGGLALERQELDASEHYYRRALAIQPDSPAVLCNLGAALDGLGRREEARAMLLRALELHPGNAAAWYNLGLQHFALAQQADAERCLRNAIALKARFRRAESTLMCLLDYIPGAERRSVSEKAEWGRGLAPLGAAATWRRSRVDPERRLRIGYVSADFRVHPVAQYISPVLDCHDRESFEVTLYYNWPTMDDIAEQLRAKAARWRNVYALSDEDLSRQIAADEIDILVDLSGHSFGNRLVAFAQGPAPVQATYMGYLGTTGVPAIQYRITDSLIDPPGMTESLQTENLVRLPGCSVCFEPSSSPPEINELPSLSRGPLTFGSLNADAKINDRVVALWARILEAVPDSRLLLLAYHGEQAGTGERFKRRFALHGVAADRVVLIGRQTREQFLRLHQQIDIALDPFPYTGGSTTFNALWMGVPVITLAGHSSLSRYGVMILSNIGLDEFIAASEDEYVAIAIRCSRELHRLAELRATLRDRFRRAPFADAAQVTRNLETVYRTLWREWCGKQAP